MKKRDKVYDDVSRVLTDYEEGEANQGDLYEMLVEIQNRWEDTITSDQ